MTTISGGAHGRPEGTVVDREVVRGLHQELIRFTRMMHLMKHSGNSGLVPPAAMPIIARLVHEGPMRSSALAELTYLDPSTVSRQVDALVKLALVRRTADPDDGRATLLEATPLGHEQLAAYGEKIASLLQDVLQGWTASQVDDLTNGLRRLNEDAAVGLPSLLERMRHTAS